MHCMNTGKHCRNRGAREIMNQRPKDRVFLWRTTNHCKWPNRITTMINRIDIHNGEIVRQAVIAQMVAKRSLGQTTVRINRATDAKVCFRADHGVGSLTHHSHGMTRQRAGKGDFRDAIGQRHYGGHRH